MNNRALPDGASERAATDALSMALAAPHIFGGVAIVNAHAEAVAAAAALPGATILPLSADRGRLLGGIDLTSALAEGRAVTLAGLLSAGTGPLVVPLASRLPEETLASLVRLLDGTLRDARDHPVPARAVIAFEDGEVGLDPRLTERLSFRIGTPTTLTPNGVPATWSNVEVAENAMEVLVAAALALGVTSLRPPVQALAAARCLAALEGADAVGERHVLAAVERVFLWRATQMPAPPNDENEQAESPPQHTEREDDAASAPTGGMTERVLDAVASGVDPAVLAVSAARRAGRRRAAMGRAGARVKTLRGRPVGVRAGLPPRDGALALVETLTAALPWRSVRGGGEERLPVRRSDLRVRRNKARSRTLTIFCVDASGSQAYAKMAEAKGAVETLLARSYVRRDEVALIAFRREGAELLLPPTSSLTRAKRLLAALPAGGGTPLASGLLASLSLSERAAAEGCDVTLILLTDARANVALDGSGGREQAGADALAAAKRVARSAMTVVLVDTGKRPGPAAKAFAEALQATYTPLGRDAPAQLSRLAAPAH